MSLLSLHINIYKHPHGWGVVLHPVKIKLREPCNKKTSQLPKI